LHINGYSNENSSTDSLNLKQLQSDIFLEINSNNTPKQLKLLEDKAVNDFLDLQNKEI
ncbi:16590_t:CDS:2, partial [Cetraspora pellucida]